MSFLDRIGKAISDTAEKAKRELDQMSRINRIRGEIRDLEKLIADCEAGIQANKVGLGEKALEMLRGGVLSQPDLQVFADQIAAFEQAITAHRAAIAEKEQAIEAIKAEEPPKPAPAAVPTPPVPPAPPAVPQGRFCPQCGAPMLEGAAFCSQCGTKVG